MVLWGGGGGAPASPIFQVGRRVPRVNGGVWGGVRAPLQNMVCLYILVSFGKSLYAKDMCHVSARISSVHALVIVTLPKLVSRHNHREFDHRRGI